MSEATNSSDLAVLKLRRELDKLTEEVGKLREDRRWYNRHLAGVVALCGVMATFAVGFAQFSSNTQRNNADLARSAREDARREIEFRLRLLDFTLAQRDKVLAGDADAQIRYLRVLHASLPQREATLILSAFAGAATQAAVLAELQALGIEIPNRPLPPGPASAAIALAPPIPIPIPMPVPPSPPKPALPPAISGQPAPPPLGQLAPTPSPVVPPAPPAPRPSPTGRLALFAHISSDADRLSATAAAAAAGDEFPLAGVEYVAAWGARPRKQGEVRYYKPAQEPAAKRLAERLEAATHQPFRTIDISGTFPNLPSNRIEVWFPDLP